MQSYHICSVIRQSFSFLNNPKNLDPSYKMGLDLWNYLGRVKPILQQNVIGTDLVICSHFRGGKTLSYSQINMVGQTSAAV